jgi:hypothetical protein
MITLADIAKGAFPLAGQGPSKEDKFYLAFGKFVCEFADVEAVMHMIFRRLSGLKDGKSRAIVGGSRLSIILSMSRRLIPITKITDKRKKELLGIFEQLNHISSFRDDLVHRGATSSEVGFVSENWMTAKTYESIEIIRFEISHIEDATYDLIRMQARLWRVFPSKDRSPTSRKLRKWIFAPWRYKSVKRENPMRQRVAKNQAPPHQRRPSPA